VLAAEAHTHYDPTTISLFGSYMVEIDSAAVTPLPLDDQRATSTRLPDLALEIAID
jgi:hypothetical protein